MNILHFLTAIVRWMLLRWDDVSLEKKYSSASQVGMFQQTFHKSTCKLKFGAGVLAAPPTTNVPTAPCSACGCGYSAGGICTCCPTVKALGTGGGVALLLVLLWQLLLALGAGTRVPELRCGELLQLPFEWCYHFHCCLDEGILQPLCMV